MAAQILDGTALAATLRSAIAERSRAVTANAGRKPGLAVILVGDDPASKVYVRNKVKACEDVGMRSWLTQLPFASTTQEVLAAVDGFNRDDDVDGILVQLPLPPGINQQEVIEAVSADKDVDGLQLHSAGALMAGAPGFWPCTPFGIIKMLDSINARIAGANAVVIGRSVSVGKPMGLMLLQRDATVTYCHSKTVDIGRVAAGADILIAAVGRANMVTAEMVKPGAVVIDVGINRGADGKLRGDVDFEAVRQKAAWISPVPGGVGPMTITMLLDNTLRSAERALANRT
jgi:methylenetetrahydrofolate dehydrogenase (NADP+)/methenyltetrahydrofolate cyclohydrolase